MSSFSLDRIAIDTELDKLEPIDRELIWLKYRYHRPKDYKGPWPAPNGNIGNHLGVKYHDRPFSARWVQRRHNKLLQAWAEQRRAGTLRRSVGIAMGGRCEL